MDRPMPTITFIQAVLRYEPDTGKLFWRHRDDLSAQHNGRYSGREAFTSGYEGGYLRGKICGRTLLAHRVIWAIVHGAWPTYQIDHANGVKSDNRINNLREATASQNQYNRPMPKNNTSGVKGVYYNPKLGKWRVAVGINGCEKYIGLFDNIADAAAAHAKAATELHGEFVNHGSAIRRDAGMG